MKAAAYIRRIISSPALLLLLLLLVAYAAAIQYPRTQLDAADALPTSLKPLVSKISRFLSSRDSPDVLMLGSSLMLCPAAYSDDELCGRKLPHDDWYYAQYLPEYSHCYTLEQLLKLKTGQSVSITNLGVIASVMSDHSLILETVVASGKRPRLVICGIAPRDFFDNNQTDIENTPTQKLLSELNSDHGLCPQDFSWSAIGDCARAHVHQGQEVLARLRSFSQQFASDLTGNPVNVHFNAGSPLLRLNQQNRLADLNDYRKTYNPPNYRLFKRHAAYLEEMLSLVRKEKIPILIVNMPLTPDNVSLLTPPAFKLYQTTIDELCTRYGAQLLDIESSNAFQLSDFQDSCHLNGTGGRKLYQQLATVMASDSRLESCLHNQNADQHHQLGSRTSDIARNSHSSSREL